MNESLIKISKLATTFFSLFFILQTFLVVEAAPPYGRAGWTTPLHEISGDTTACAEGQLALTLELRNTETDEPVNVSSAIVASFDNSVSPRQLVDMDEGPGPRVGPVCWTPETDSIAFDINGGAEYYNFFSSFITNYSGLPTQKEVTGIVWLTPRSLGYDYEQIYPSPTYTTIASSSPQYTYALNRIPNIHGASGLRYVHLFVAEFDPNIGDYTNFVVNRERSQSGGVGTRTLPAESLSDGWYGWSMYLHLNRNIDIGYDVRALDVPKSGFFQLWNPFILDTTPPDLVISHSPPSPSVGTGAQISATASDELTGVDSIDIYLDGVLMESCSYIARNVATCETTTSPLASGVYEYYAVARDTAGNTVTSDFFTIIVIADSVPGGEPMSCEFPETVVLDSANALTGMGNSGLQAMQKIGNYIFAGGAGPSSADAKGLFIYDISDLTNIQQVSFFSTTNPPEVRNRSHGNDVLGLDIVGNYAYLATYLGGLVIVDISDLANPTFVGRIPLYNRNSGSTETWEVEVVGDYAFLAAGRGMHVVDVSDKANPELIANLDLGIGTSQDIFVSDNYAYISGRHNGIRIVDISDPYNPFMVGSLTSGYYNSNIEPLLASWAYSSVKKGHILYVADHLIGEISVIDVSNPTNPVRLRTLKVGSALNWQSRILHIDGDLMYLGAGRNGVYVYDISSPEFPTLLYGVGVPPLFTGLYAWRVMPINPNDFRDLVFVSYDRDTNGAAIYVLSTACEPEDDDTDTPSLSGTGCEIEADRNTCNGQFTWDAVGADSANLFDSSNNITLSSENSGTNEPFQLNYGTTTVKLRSDTDVLLSIDVNATCALGLNWDTDSNTCVDLTPPVIVTITGHDCEIAEEESNCDATIEWEIENASNPGLRNNTNTITFEHASGTRSITINPNMHEDVRTFRAYDGVVPIDDSVELIATCAPGLNWDDDSNTCVDPTPPVTVYITGDDCEIAEGGTVCDATIEWEIENASDPSLRNLTDDITFPEPSGSGNVPINPDTPVNYRTFRAYDGSTAVSSNHVLNATCIGVNIAWNSTTNTCAYVPYATINSFDSDTLLVRFNETTNISWDIDGDAEACEITGWLNDGGDIVNSFTLTSASGTIPTAPITGQRRYQITCTAFDGAPDNIENITINVLPRMYES